MTGTSLQAFMDNAVGVLNRFGIVKAKDAEEYRISKLLETIVEVNPPKITAIARVLEYQGTFNQLVRDNVKDINVGDRYGDITSKFDSVRDDAKQSVKQLEDGKIDTKEKLQNFWMKLSRGSVHNRFDWYD